MVVFTNDILLSGPYTIYYKVTLDDAAGTVVEKSFILTLTDPCVTTTITSQPDINPTSYTVPVGTSQVIQLKWTDVGSLGCTTGVSPCESAGMPRYGLEFCGLRRYYINVDLDASQGVPASMAAFTTQSTGDDPGDTITIAPTLDSEAGVSGTDYTFDVTCCMDSVAGSRVDVTVPIDSHGKLCSTTTYTIRISPCEITSFTNSGGKTTVDPPSDPIIADPTILTESTAWTGAFV